MPTRKTLKSVAHNIGHRLMSLMNHDGSMYFCERIFEMVKETGITKIEFDFTNRTITPKEFDVPMVRLRSHFDWIPYSAETEKSSTEFIKSIKMTLGYDLSKTKKS